MFFSFYFANISKHYGISRILFGRKLLESKKELGRQVFHRFLRNGIPEHFLTFLRGFYTVSNEARDGPNMFVFVLKRTFEAKYIVENTKLFCCCTNLNFKINL